MNNEKPMDVSDWEWRVGRLIKSFVEFLALCCALLILQAAYSVFNPANPPDTDIRQAEVKRATYLSCVSESRVLFGVEWQRAIDACGKKAELFLHKRLDLPNQ